MNTRSLLYTIILGGLILCYPLSKAKSETSASVCIGYDELRRRWGWEDVESKNWIYCPPQHAIFGTAVPPRMNVSEARSVSIEANCCRLPAGDILSSTHVISETLCPPGHLVTGAEIIKTCRTCTRHIRCTAINQQKYLLGTARNGVFWGLGTNAAFPWKEKKRIRRDRIPASLRYGISRVSRNEFLEQGCVGEPPGSVLVGKTEPGCVGLLWAELYRKIPGKDPVPVKTYSECQYVRELLSTNPVCDKK